MEFICAYDLETEFQGGKDNLLKKAHRFEITQAAGIIANQHILMKNSKFWAWTSKANIKNLTGPFSGREELVLLQFFDWILMLAKTSARKQQKLYMVAHNGLLFDLPYIEIRVLEIMRKPEWNPIFKNILSNNLWQEIIWIDSLTMACKYMAGNEPDYKLPSLYKTTTGKDIENAHNALPDAEAVKVIMDQMPKDVFPGRKACWVKTFLQTDWLEDSVSPDLETDEEKLKMIVYLRANDFITEKQNATMRHKMILEKMNPIEEHANPRKRSRLEE